MTTATADQKVQRPNIIRRLYDWVVSWADSPYGLVALFLIALVESSVFPIPPDVLLIALAFGAPKRAFKFALICTAGSVIGALVGYMIGAFFFETIGMWVVNTYGLETHVAKVTELYHENAFTALMVAGFTPIPFKLFTILAGMVKIPITTLVIASAISRTGRFVVVAGVIYFMGPKAKTFIDKYFDLLTVLFTVLLIGGFVLVKYLI